MNLTEKIIELGELCLRFGRVDRITRHPDGVTAESDTDHTVMLGVVGCAFAANYLPRLDVGRVAQFALVHDLVEAYAGDTPTLRIDADGEAAKRTREVRALGKLHWEFGNCLPWVLATITRYEDQDTPEARYVRALDKLLPKITHLLNGGQTFREQDMDAAEAAARYERQVGELTAYAADFPELMQLRAELVEQVMMSCFPTMERTS